MIPIHHHLSPRVKPLTMSLHPLDQATQLTAVPAAPVPAGLPDAHLRETRLSGVSSDAYWNFAGPFGGYIAALFMRAIQQDARRLGPPVAQTVNYCAAMAKGTFDILVKLQRSGKATQHWSLELHQSEVVVATCSIVCANRRSTFAHQTISPPIVPPSASVPVSPRNDRLPWLNAYEFRFIDGGPDFGQARDTSDLGPSLTLLWLKDHPDRPLDFIALAGLSDCFILRLVQMRGTLPPMGTVSMTTYFHADDAELAAQGIQPLLGIADAKRFKANFHDQSMDLWSHAGHLLATGMQTVWYKD
jgi:acyl-CoA thioesterase